MTNDTLRTAFQDIYRQKEWMSDVSRLAAELDRTAITSFAEHARQFELANLADSFRQSGLSDLALRFPQFDLPPLVDSATVAAFTEMQNRLALASEPFKFALPPRDDILLIAQHIAEFVEPHRRFMEGLEWQNDLASRMASINVAWTMPDSILHSGVAFGKLAHLSDVVHFDAPFAPVTRDYVENKFGTVIQPDDDADAESREEKYGEAGRDAALVAFPTQEYPAVIMAAGFSLSIPTPPAPQPIENITGEAIYSDEHHAVLRSVEVHMRMFVSAELTAAAGIHWIKQRVPGDMRARWENKRDAARAVGWPVFDLIHYADFNDLAQVITLKPNWDSVFKAVFGNKEGVQESLRRLSPLRNDNAHHRPLCQTEILFLAAEATRLMRAIGVLRLN